MDSLIEKISERREPLMALEEPDGKSEGFSDMKSLGHDAPPSGAL
jgi:hypothetical protein